MREIKFRAWYKDAEQMLNVRDINFCGEDLDAYEMEGDWLSFQDVELMQYTGLKDKNGKEIYEGDIVKEDFSIGKVTFNQGCLEIDWIKNYNSWSDTLRFHVKHIEVVGNIYENSDLLEVQNA